MSDRIRQGTAYLIAVAMVLAVAAGPTVAQTTDENAERVFEAAGLDVDKVDGLDAAKYTTNRVKRAGKIVATNANGVLPSNIVKPQWRVIQNKPAGFKDGVDDAGVTKIKLTRVVSNPVTVTPGDVAKHHVSCPTGMVAVGGGYELLGSAWGSVPYQSMPYSDSVWGAGLAVPSTASSGIDFYVYAVCMSTQPGGGLITSTKNG